MGSARPHPAHLEIVRGARARISTPLRCRLRSVAPCDNPCLASSSRIVAPSSYSFASCRAVASLICRFWIVAPSVRSIRVSAELATSSSRANDRTLSPASARCTSSATFFAPSRFDSSCGRYETGLFKPTGHCRRTASFRRRSGVRLLCERFEQRSRVPAKHKHYPKNHL